MNLLPLVLLLLSFVGLSSILSSHKKMNRIVRAGLLTTVVLEDCVVIMFMTSYIGSSNISEEQF